LAAGVLIRDSRHQERPKAPIGDRSMSGPELIAMAEAVVTS
jgi:hypothetical protein